MILVDTSVWIEFLKGENSAPRQALHRLIEDEEDLAVTEIILTEVLQGISKDRDFRRIKDELLEFTIVRPHGLETYVQAAQLYRECRRQGKTVRKTVDCIIAAICLENDLALLHRDRDFDLIAACTGLKIFKWGSGL
jgi:hypothetical protein